MGEAAALVAAFTWSATSVALTSLSARTSPVALSTLRLLCGSLVLVLVLIPSGQLGDIEAASAATLVAMLGSGFFAYAVGDTIYIKALSIIGMQKTFPITMALFIGLTVVGGIVILDEPFKWGLPAGAAFIGLGISLIVLPSRRGGTGAVPSMPSAEPALASFADLPMGGQGGGAGASTLGGYGLLLVVAVSWAIATLWLAAGEGELGAVAAGTLRIPAGAVGLLAFALYTQPRELAAPFANRRHLGAIVASGVAGTAFGSLLYVYAVLEAGAARTAVLSASAPLMALPLSVMFLGERLTGRVLVGTVLCVAGIVLVVG